MKRLSLALLTAATAVPLIACAFLQNLPIPNPGLNRNPTAAAKPAATAPRPSPTDIRAMGPFFGPPYVHFVIGVADRENPVARAWYIEDGAAHEHAFDVIEG